MPKPTRVIITDNNIIGTEIKSHRFVNLTSCNSNALRPILANISFLPERLTFLKLGNGLIRFCNEDGKAELIENRKRTTVTYIVDHDDKYYSNKIKNLTHISKLIAVTIITIKPSFKNKNTGDYKPGLVRRICHQGHTTDVRKELNADYMTQSIYNNVSKVVLVKTTDKRCGSIGALVLILNSNNTSYSVEQCIMDYNEGWIDTKDSKLYTRILDWDSTNDSSPNSDSFWSFKAGYGDFVMTTKGVKKLTKQNKKKTKKPTLLNRIGKIIKNMVLKLKSMMRHMIKIIKQLIMRSTNDEENDKNKTEEVKTKTSIAFLPINEIATIGSMTSALVVSSFKKNASKDINQANKTVAGMQLNKMMARSGIGGDKTILNNKRSKQFNAYLTGITSYNVTDATITANNLAAKDYKTKRNKINAVLMLIIIVTMSTTGLSYMIPISALVLVFDHYTTYLKNTRLYLLLASMLTGSLIMTATALTTLFIETYVQDHQTMFVRHLLYLIITCLILIV